MVNHARSYKLLKEAREQAKKDCQYCSETWRSRVRHKIEARCHGRVPYWYQEDVAEAFHLELDVVIVAGTGFGKTLPFVMPLLVEESDSKVIIVSPLNALERDQATRFRDMGLTAVAVNGEDYSHKLHQQLEADHFRVIITSPEMILKHPRFSKLMRSSSWMKNVGGIIVDEAHCVAQWGDDFREAFTDLEQARSFTARKPLMIASATLSPGMLETVYKKLSFSKQTTFHLNLGNQRHNITQIVCCLPAAARSCDSLDFLLAPAFRGEPLERAIVYVKTRELAMQLWLDATSKIPDTYRLKLGFCNSVRESRTKSRVVRLFMEEKIDIVYATDAMGMGMDIPRCSITVQFMVPDSISDYTQHFGRGGQNGDPAISVLLVELSVYQMTRK
ncbi:P-loop containing nucleoside triphosphate hydrolase protein, partial [Cytidiella melzeri]